MVVAVGVLTKFGVISPAADQWVQSSVGWVSANIIWTGCRVTSQRCCPRQRQRVAACTWGFGVKGNLAEGIIIKLNWELYAATQAEADLDSVLYPGRYPGISCDHM